jgi:hypothetical protein
MTKLSLLSLAALLATAAVASAQDGPSAAMSEGMIYNDSDDMNADNNFRIQFARVETSAAGVIELYDYRIGEIGELVGSVEVDAGTNWNVRIPIGSPRTNDLIALLKIDGEVVDPAHGHGRHVTERCPPRRRRKTDAQRPSRQEVCGSLVSLPNPHGDVAMIDAPTPLRWGSAMLLALCSALPSAQAEVIVRGEEGFPLHEARPAPTSLQPDFALVVAQPSPSEVNPSFLGPVLLMKSAHVDLEAGTATVPLREGQLPDGRKVWFIITDVSDRDLAELHGVPYSAKMAYGLTGDAYREASIETDGTWTFADGTVDFAPEWSVMPGEAPNFFPPTAAQPGSVGDAAYSPLVSITNAGKGITFNAPMIAFDQERGGAQRLLRRRPRPCRPA